MSLRARLVASIVALVAATVVLLSVLFLRATLQTSFGDARRIADENAQQVESFLLPRAQTAVQRMEPAPETLDDVADAYVRAIAADDELDDLLANLMANSAVLIEALITGPDGQVLAASLDSRQGSTFEALPSLAEFEGKTLVARLLETFSGNQDYDVVRELGIGDRQLLTVHMVVSSLLMREHYLEPLRPLAIGSLVALLASILAAIVVSRLAVRPFEKIGEQIDRITRGEQEEGLATSQAKELAAVESKLTLLGERFRGARADTEELKGSIDQLLDRLEQAVLLFGPDDKLVMAGGAAERLTGGGRWELMGQSLEEVFPEETRLGALIQSSVRMRRQTKDHPVIVDDGAGGAQRNLLVSIELVEDFVTHGRMGTLVTLRESEPRRQIEAQLDLSTRMAAISRLTSGAAHEIKNPLNSIALHLEVLKQKLADETTGLDEIEVISREIERLDRVVKSFLDFTKPVELNLREFDLAELVRELGDLVKLDAETQGVRVETSAEQDRALVRGDRDLLKQALLNVVVNALQATPREGSVQLTLEALGEDWLVRIKDDGCGIPEDVRSKIYQLYFTTKGKGSGIGLAMTFQVVQLHGGTIDFATEVGKGTEFRVLIPARQGSAASLDDASRPMPAQESR